MRRLLRPQAGRARQTACAPLLRMARGRLRATAALLCLLLVSLAQSAQASAAHTISAMQREMVRCSPRGRVCGVRGTASRASERQLTPGGAQERRAERSAEHASMVTRVAKRREAALARDPTARAAQLRDAAALLGALLHTFCGGARAGMRSS